MTDDLKLNSLSRFSKQSPRLHLEEHGHCEVPAGCGGVVLRWYNPSKGIPVLFNVYTPRPPRALLLNGVPPISMRPLVPPGETVLALEFDGVTPAHALLMIAAARPADGRYSIPDDAPALLRSNADGTWRFSTSAPPDGWMMPSFDAVLWPELVERPLAPPRSDDYRGSSAFRRLTEIGARPLGLPPERGRVGLALIRNVLDRAKRVWIRKAFTLPQE